MHIVVKGVYYSKTILVCVVFCVVRGNVLVSSIHQLLFQLLHVGKL